MDPSGSAGALADPEWSPGGALLQGRCGHFGGVLCINGSRAGLADR